MELTKMKRLACFHLLNDFSGSPKVLKMVLDGLCTEDVDVDLYTSNTNGTLDELKGHKNCKMHTYKYKFSNNSFVTFVRYSRIQMLTFFWSFRYVFSKDVVFYINTLLPIGPALAGRMMGKRVVYHYHENADIKGAFYKLLAAGMQKLAHEIICVSKHQSLFLKRKDLITLVPNALPINFIDKLTPNIDLAFQRKTVLMLGSLKEYKGTVEFFQLAAAMPEYPFVLVLNETQENIDALIRDKGLLISANLTIYPRQSDVAPFYNQSTVVLNLSNKDLFVETFGLTALEAMSAGLPVIVPTVGGIAEMVEDGVNGYKIDVQHLNKIQEAVTRMLTAESLYKKLAQNALEYSQQYREENMIKHISNIIWRTNKTR